MKSKDGRRIGIPEIATAIDAPTPFTAKILQTLAREGIISSIKGPNGGFYVDPDAEPVLLSDIITAIDGSDQVLSSCALGLRDCSDKYPCPIHHQVKQYKDRLRKVMKSTTIQDLSLDLAKGKTFLRLSRRSVR